MTYDSRAVANKVLDIAAGQGNSLTMMQVIKLVYIAHGWWLSFSGGQPLTSDTPQAWQYGPVYPNLYQAFRSNGSRPVRKKALDPITGLEFQGDFSNEVGSMLEQVVGSYGDMHAFQLSDMTHQPGTPWEQASRDGYYAPISNYVIKEHFDDLRRQRSA